MADQRRINALYGGTIIPQWLCLFAVSWLPAVPAGSLDSVSAADKRRRFVSM